MSTRLATVAALVPAGTRVADIGTDHGRLARLLLEGRSTPHCIATDRDERALAILRPLASRLFPDGELEVRRGDGLAALRPEDRIRTVVIAGLGGRTIVRLLAPAHRLAVEQLVLQPQTEAARVRRWLVENGFAIVAERVAEERGRFYEILAARAEVGWQMPRLPGLSEEDLYEVGPRLVRDCDPRVRRMWESRRDRLATIVAGSVTGAAGELAATRAAQARRILERLPAPRPARR